MNERITDLHNQAIIFSGKNGGLRISSHIPNDYIEKFAELIVKKFDDILLLQQLDCIGNHDKQSAELIEQIRDKTKTYFGVEE
jgi:hypothetical protein